MSASKSSLSSTDSNEFLDLGETTALINAAGSAVTAEIDSQVPFDSSTDDVDDFLEYRQIILPCFTALVEPVAFFTIFPFVNEMIHVKGNVAETDVGFWAGLIESLFSLVQMAVMVFYGRLIDRVGRKPVLVFTLTGLAVSAALFGMAQSLAQMIALRALAGVFGGSVVTTRVMIMESCTKEPQAKVFSWYMFSRHIGALLGPLIGKLGLAYSCAIVADDFIRAQGGPLAKPAEQFPRFFGGFAFWERYPYALSTYLAGTIILLAALLSLLFLKDTLDRKTGGRSVKATLTTSEILRSPGVPMVLYLHFHVIVLSLAYTAVSTVMMYTCIGYGGYGFSDQEIALFLTGTGGGQAIWVLLVFPYLQREYSTSAVLKLCGILWPLFLITFPILNECLRRDWTRFFWIAAPITWALGSSVGMSLGEYLRLLVCNIL